MVGGFDGNRQLASVERYDTENQVWDSVAPIQIARSALSLTVLDGKLYAMGGFDGHSFLNIVDVYDPSQDKWEESTALTSGRSGHASAVIYQPSCANQYMECVEDQIDRSKKPPEDEEKPGPSSGSGSGGSSGGPSKCSPPSASSSNQLHAFSGNRCTHCDGVNNNDSHHEHTEQIMTQRKNQCSMNQSKYEQECRDAIHSLIRMDHEEKIRNDQSECNEFEKPPENDITNTNSGMDISEDEATNDYEAFDIDDPKKFRRKISFNCEDSEMSEMSENSNSVDSSSSNITIPGHRNRLKVRPTEGGQCSLSRLKNKVRQNICDFVTWSSSSAAPLPKAIPQDSNSNNLNSLSNLPSKDALSEGRKCDLLRKYYKCKMKYCNNPK